MYDNIGGKIKGLAKTMFIVEVIGAVITGIVLLATDYDLIFAGLLTLFCGPIVAWVGSWILYAFGELVGDVHAMRNKYYPIAEEQANLETEEKAKHEAEEITHEKAQTFTCPNCQRKVYYGNPMCECGQTFDWSKM